MANDGAWRLMTSSHPFPMPTILAQPQWLWYTCTSTIAWLHAFDVEATPPSVHIPKIEAFSPAHFWSECEVMFIEH